MTSKAAHERIEPLEKKTLNKKEIKIMAITPNVKLASTSLSAFIARYEDVNGGHYFSKGTMRFFGDSRSNYRVTRNTVNIETRDGIIECFELCRKKPVKNGLHSPTYFNVDTMKVEFLKEEF